MSVGEALDSLLDGTGLRYREGQRQIFIGPEGTNGTDRAPIQVALTGRVVEAGGGSGVEGAQVTFSPEGGRVSTREDGRFSLPPLAPGAHSLRVQALGFLETTANVDVTEEPEAEINLELLRAPIPLEAIIISPGRFGLLEGSPGAMGTRISRKEMESIPDFGGDAFRALKTMPGVASGDISTQLNVRGSTGRDLLIRLDGLELYEPYHLRDMDGVFGIVDIQALGEIDLLTGGFGPEQGGRYGGLFDMRTREAPPSGTRNTLGMSLSSLSATSQGTFADGRGDWLSAARWGFLDLVLNITDVGDDISPTYWDVLGKTEYRLSDTHRVAAHFLLAGDRVSWKAEDTGSDLLSDWTNRYLWGSWEALFTPKLRAVTLVALGGFKRDRGGRTWRPLGGTFSPFSGRVSDEGEYSVRQLRQDWQLDLGEAFLLKTGFDVRAGSAAYDYFGKAVFLDLSPNGGLVQVPDSTRVDLNVHGWDMAGWGALRAKVGDALTGEVGIRFDRQTHTGESDLAPRLLLRWDPRPSLTLRGSWGRYVQPQRVHELSAPDGEVAFSPSEMAEQVAVGIEGQAAGGLGWRVEGYLRNVKSPFPEFLNLSREINAFLELQTDRVRIDPSRGRGRGLEFLLSLNGSGPLSWSGSYVLAEAEQEVEEAWSPRTLDQRHTLNFRAAYRLGRKWQISGAYQYHTGWPVTEQYAEAEVVGEENPSTPFLVRRYFGPLNGIRLPAYKRLDLRVTRDVQLQDSRIELFLDIFNVLNESNLRSYQYDPDFRYVFGGHTLRTPGDELLPILPTLGFRWVF
jgi:hypothetical protein